MTDEQIKQNAEEYASTKEMHSPRSQDVELDKLMIIEDYIATMVFFGITDDGYFVAYIPESWDDITFNTTGLDINLPIQPEYGHLVLSY